LSPERIRLPSALRAASVVSEPAEVYTRRLWAAELAAAEQRGHKRGHAEALARYADTIQKVVEGVEDAGERAVEGLAARTAVLVAAVSSQVLRQELEAGRYNIERMVRDTLATAATGRSPCTVRVHPDDAQKLAAVPFRSGTSVEADSEVAPGCVQVESAHGLVVREIEEILRQLRANLERVGP